MTMHGKDHDCRAMLADISDYLDGDAAAEICAAIEAHMADCENCRVVVDTMGQTIRLYRTLPQPDLPEEVRARLYKSLDLEAYITPDS